MGCFCPENVQKIIRISSEEKGISSEVIAISSEEIRIPSEEMGFSSEFIPQRKEKKYISIYISFSIYVVERTRVCVCIVCAYARRHIRTNTTGKKKTCKESSIAGRKKINLGSPPVGLSL